MKKFKVLCVVGTRPEAIKMAPVIGALKSTPSIEVVVLATAQHRGLLDQVFDTFSIKQDFDLDVMVKNQTLPELTARLMVGIDQVLMAVKPDLVVAQGDTTTVFTTALATFYKQIPFAHVEAGLRTHNLYSPFPEEGNRVLVGHLTNLHFAPTHVAKNNLMREGILERNIYVTGNTVIDALLFTAAQRHSVALPIPATARVILVTSHRRENFGAPLHNICDALRKLVDKYTDLHIVFPVHPNPNVRLVVDQYLSGHSRVLLVPPQGYEQFVALMQRAYLILSDSGGVQEEAPALGKPVLVLRNETERMEALDAGVTKLVGTDVENILRETSLLLDNPAEYKKMVSGGSPYGDGRTSQKIVNIMLDYLVYHQAMSERHGVPA